MSLLENKTKQCSSCVKNGELSEKLLSEFRLLKSKNKTWLGNICLKCRKIQKKKWDVDNKEKNIEYRQNNDKYIKERNLKYRNENKDKIKLYKQNTIEHIKEYNHKYGKIPSNIQRKKLWEENYKEVKNIKRKEKWNNDFGFRLRLSISKHILLGLKKLSSNKNGESCLKYLPYSINELKEHIGKQFEPWMSWSNWGVFSGWIDNDPSTWRWQIDHIIPQSDLPYSSMSDDNFKKCWALSNLRPLSAKQNNSDGATRARHEK